MLMKQRVNLVLLSLVILMSACRTGERAQRTTLVEADDSETFELLSTEQLVQIWLGGETQIDAISIAAANQRLEEYTDGAGSTTEQWQAAIWLSHEQCYAVGGRSVHVGDVVEFIGFHIRVLSIDSECIFLAVSGQLLDSQDLQTACASSIYHRLPEEELVMLYHESETVESITFTKTGEPWTEEYTVNKVTLTGPAIQLSLVLESSDDTWEGTLHTGESIEIGDYRVRILGINDVYIKLAVGNLQEIK
jgi:hypothetical protein